MASPKGIYELDTKGKLTLNFHPGQSRAWDSIARFVLVLAGTQSGKTSFGPWWLWREVMRNGAGDYLAVSATYDLFKLKMLPEIRYVFEVVLGIARYWAGEKILEIKDPVRGYWANTASEPMYARIILRSASSEGGLESATAKAVWLDEVGHPDYGIGAWQAIRRRLSLSKGRLLGTTTLYNFGWLKTEVYDRWVAGDQEFEVIQFDSTENPLFPREEFEEARSKMPGWLFDLFYRGRYTRPAGMIYDAFDENRHVIDPFRMPPSWPKYIGMDFGGVNTAGVFIAHDPDSGNYYVYREYLAGKKTAQEHVPELLKGEVGVPIAVGGSASEDQWRLEFSQAGIPVVKPPITDVELGITRVYGLHSQNRLYIFRTCPGYLDQKIRYARKLDKSGQVTEDIEDKSSFHFMDAERYAVAYLEHESNIKEVDYGIVRLYEDYRGI